MDDIALFEEMEKDMANTTRDINQSASKLGLMMSFKKTEIMPIGHHSNKDPTVPLGDKGGHHIDVDRSMLKLLVYIFAFVEHLFILRGP